MRSSAHILYRASLPLVVLAVLLLIFPSPYLPLGFLFVPLLFGLRWLGRGAPFPRLRVNGALLALFATLVVGLLWSPLRREGVLIAAHAVAGLALLYSIYDWTRGDVPSQSNNSFPLETNSSVETVRHISTTMTRLWAVIAGLVMLGIAFALATPFTTIGASMLQCSNWEQSFALPILDTRMLFCSDAQTIPRLGESSNPNNVAGGLEAAVPLALALIASGKVGWRMMGVLALPPLLGMLWLIQSRGAFLAVLMGLVVYATLYRRWFLPLIPLILLGALALNAYLGAPVPTQPFYAENVVSAPETLEGRSSIWAQAVPILVRAPFGVGVGGFRVVAETQLADVLGEPQRGHAHNLFLQIALDAGIIAGVAFLFIFAASVYNAWRAYRTFRRNVPIGDVSSRTTRNPGTLRDDASGAHALAIGLLAAFVVIATHGMVDTIFWGAKPGIVMWTLFGAALALGDCIPTTSQ